MFNIVYIYYYFLKEVWLLNQYKQINAYSFKIVLILIWLAEIRVGPMLK